ncbi:MAG: DUF6088 family protein [Casimicrobiaceae bacterium]
MVIDTSLETQILRLMTADHNGQVWVPADFAHLSGRDAIDKALQRLVQTGDLRRINRGLYDRPRVSRLTKQATSPDYREVVDAVARRNQVRMLVDGMTPRMISDLRMQYQRGSRFTRIPDGARFSLIN